MNAPKHFRAFLLASIFIVALLPLQGIAQDASKTSPQPVPAKRDGQHDFDFAAGTWKTRISRLQHPLTGSTTWIKYEGTVVARKVWEGRGYLEELEIDGPTGHLEGLTLRLYNPAAHQWNLSFANSDDGTLNQPLIGEFTNGRGEFIDQESFNGKTILVRHVFSDITPDSHHFEQAFSDDGGKTWEPNWIADLTRQTSSGAAQDGTRHANVERDGQHDFDFNLGTWKTHVSRLVHPLTGSTAWVEYEGVSVVRKVWNGRASLFELEVDGSAGHIEGLGLRLYNPLSHQWNLNWANSTDGTMTKPMIGEFKNGRGEFFDQESFSGRAIYVRNGFSNITPNSSRFEQAFSDDGGKTWETNWVMTFTLMKDESEKVR
ncbi:MAG TPA: hypothetical protein VGQ55_01515 [Pyrinomonadaceae bacterium]|jgi:hypothetical protein|nr:hypothetical protein [Pyrinomonadaceae bacterium]